MRMKEAHMLTAQRKAGYNTLVGTENKFVIGHDDFPESVDFKNVRESSSKCYKQVGKFYIAQTARLGTSHFTITCSKMERAEQIVSKFCMKYPQSNAILCTSISSLQASIRIQRQAGLYFYDNGLGRECKKRRSNCYIYAHRKSIAG